jgi:hypothetical protein
MAHDLRDFSSMIDLPDAIERPSAECVNRLRRGLGGWICGSFGGNRLRWDQRTHYSGISTECRDARNGAATDAWKVIHARAQFWRYVPVIRDNLS